MRRIYVAALSLSAIAFAGIVAEESYTGRAVVPTKNDRPTVGFGSTFRDDGSPVQMGDTITPVHAIRRSIAHIAKDEVGLRRCVTAPMSQTEYDVLVDFAYQYGVSTTCNSTVVRQTNAGRYEHACDGYTLYRYSGGYDCSTPGNRVCSGVWARNLARQAKCLAGA